MDRAQKYDPECLISHNTSASFAQGNVKMLKVLHFSCLSPGTCELITVLMINISNISFTQWKIAFKVLFRINLPGQSDPRSYLATLRVSSVHHSILLSWKLELMAEVFVLVVSNSRHDLISRLPGVLLHDILIMKLTGAKKWPRRACAWRMYHDRAHSSNMGATLALRAPVQLSIVWWPNLCVLSCNQWLYLG